MELSHVSCPDEMPLQLWQMAPGKGSFPQVGGMWRVGTQTAALPPSPMLQFFATRLTSTLVPTSVQQEVLPAVKLLLFSSPRTAQRATTTQGTGRCQTSHVHLQTRSVAWRRHDQLIFPGPTSPIAVRPPHLLHSAVPQD